MSDYEGITGELRDAIKDAQRMLPLCEPVGASVQVRIRIDFLLEKLDVIDSIHAQLERENAALKAELDRVLGEQDEHTYSIGSATITVTPRLDWSAVAADLRELTALCERTKEEA